jgi:hypothetical protein
MVVNRSCQTEVQLRVIKNSLPTLPVVGQALSETAGIASRTRARIGHLSAGQRAGLALQLGTFAGLVQEQEPQLVSSEGGKRKRIRGVEGRTRTVQPGACPRIVDDLTLGSASKVLPCPAAQLWGFSFGPQNASNRTDHAACQGGNRACARHRQLRAGATATWFSCFR